MPTAWIETLTFMSGCLGTALIVLAYYLNSSQTLSSTDPRYLLLNLAGAVALGINVFHKQAWPAVALEVIWAGIAIMALIKTTQRK